uniref:Fibronectin type-III domain-containing protein n=1 Tax=Macrostomum lignano TaxID=282301 RepID=A0A1I8F436_9PLAT
AAQPLQKTPLVLENNPNRVVLSWSPPEYTGGRNDTRYVVECVDCGGARLVYEPASSLTDRPGHGSRPAARDGLHTFRIFALNGVPRLPRDSASESSACDWAATPSSITVKIESSASVRVSWSSTVTRWAAAAPPNTSSNSREQLDAYKEHLLMSNLLTGLTQGVTYMLQSSRNTKKLT